MILPATPCVPGGPSGRRCPGPKRVISTDAQPRRALPDSAAAAATAPSSPAAYRCLRLLVARLAEEASPPELLVVGGNDGREAEEADRDEGRDADHDDQEREQEVE